MATSSVVPALIDALVNGAAALTGPALPLEGVLVFDGFGVTEDPGDVLMVGVEDPDETDAAQAADSKQSWHDSGQAARRDEVGSVTCCALSWNGNGPDGGAKQARDRVYAIVDQVAAMCRTTPDLGVAELLWTGYGSSGQLHQNQDEQGAVAWLIFSIEFTALI
jgi:hypothetical protein